MADTGSVARRASSPGYEAETELHRQIRQFADAALASTMDEVRDIRKENRRLKKERKRQREPEEKRRARNERRRLRRKRARERSP
jgi:DNA repair photolyase